MRSGKSATGVGQRWLAALLLLAGGCDTAVVTLEDAGVPDDAGAVPPADLATEPDGDTPTPPPSFGATVSSAEPLPPLSGGTLRLSRDGKRALVSDPERDRVLLVDLRALTIVAEVALEEGDEPGRSVEDAAGRFHVALRRGGALATVDGTGRLQRRSACPAPRGLAYRAGTDELLLACAGGELMVFEAAGRSASRSVHLERDLRDVVIDEKSGLAYASIFRTATLLELDQDLHVSRRISPDYPGWIPTVAFRLVARPGGGLLLAHQLTDAGVISTQEGGYGGGSICAGSKRPPVVMAALTRFDGSGALTSVDSGALPGVVLPVDVSVAPDRHVAVTSAGSARVAAMPQVVTLQADLVAGRCAAYPDPAPIAGQVVALAYDPDGNLWVQTREPSALLLREGPRKGSVPVPAVALGGAPRSDTGWDIFHADSGARLACASCHPEGGDDGRTWKFDFGARRTQWLKGGVGRRPPFHWNGDVTDLGELLDNVFSLRMIGPRLDGAQRDALANWLDTIPQLPAPATMDGGAAARGKALFEDASVGCSRCHKGPQLTNDDVTDIGREMPFKVPGLLDVADHPPFLHDGCAATLRDRFRPECGGAEHGDVSGLLPAQLDDLVAYLESL